MNCQCSYYVYKVSQVTASEIISTMILGATSHSHEDFEV